VSVYQVKSGLIRAAPGTFLRGITAAACTVHKECFALGPAVRDRPLTIAAGYNAVSRDMFAAWCSALSLHGAAAVLLC
jgi:hypothetical protein